MQTNRFNVWGSLSCSKGYIDSLIERGYKVAICEQVEDPKTAKGMVKREVVQLITPGTAMDTKSMDAKTNNYLAALTSTHTGHYHLAYADLSTGELKTTTLNSLEAVMSELMSLKAKEVVFKEAMEVDVQAELETKLGIMVSTQKEMMERAEFSYLTSEIENSGLIDVVKLLFSYLYVTQKRNLGHLQKVEVYSPTNYLKMDHYSKHNLELISSIRTGQKKGLFCGCWMKPKQQWEEDF